MVKEFIEEHSDMLTKDFQKLLQTQVDEYAKKIGEVNSLEELDNLEKEVIKEMEEFDEYANGIQYQLPEYVEFEGVTITKKDIQKWFSSLLSSMEMNWEFVPTIYTLCNIWQKGDTKEVSHGIIDSTIRILGKIKVKGYSEYRKMMIIDRYLDPLIEDYGKVTSYQIAMGHRHNEIMKRRQMLAPVTNSVADEAPIDC